MTHMWSAVWETHVRKSVYKCSKEFIFAYADSEIIIKFGDIQIRLDLDITKSLLFTLWFQIAFKLPFKKGIFSFRLLGNISFYEEEQLYYTHIYISHCCTINKHYNILRSGNCHTVN